MAGVRPERNNGWESTSTETEGFTLKWDGRSEAGEEQPPGVYLYLIEDGAEVIASGSIVLAR